MVLIQACFCVSDCFISFRIERVKEQHTELGCCCALLPSATKHQEAWPHPKWAPSKGGIGCDTVILTLGTPTRRTQTPVLWAGRGSRGRSSLRDSAWVRAFTFTRIRIISLTSFLNSLEDNFCADCNKNLMKFSSWGIDVLIAEFSNHLSGRHAAICQSRHMAGLKYKRQRKLEIFLPCIKSNMALKRSLFPAGEVAQWLPAMAALPEDPGSIPITRMTAHSHLYLQFQSIWCPLLASSGTAVTE